MDTDDFMVYLDDKYHEQDFAQDDFRQKIEEQVRVVFEIDYSNAVYSQERLLSFLEQTITRHYKESQKYEAAMKIKYELSQDVGTLNEVNQELCESVELLVDQTVQNLGHVKEAIEESGKTAQAAATLCEAASGLAKVTEKLAIQNHLLKQRLKTGTDDSEESKKHKPN